MRGGRMVDVAENPPGLIPRERAVPEFAVLSVVVVEHFVQRFQLQRLEEPGTSGQCDERVGVGGCDKEDHGTLSRGSRIGSLREETSLVFYGRFNSNRSDVWHQNAPPNRATVFSFRGSTPPFPSSTSSATCIITASPMTRFAAIAPVPHGMICFTTHSIATGASAIRGGFTFRLGTVVSPRVAPRSRCMAIPST